MNLLARILAAGGWLAHQSNQMGASFYGDDNDIGIQPRGIVFCVGASWLVGALAVAASVAAVGRGQPVATIGVGLMLALPFFVLGLLMVLGWRARFVPFVAMGGTVADTGLQVTRVESEPIRITGIVPVDGHGGLRVYRHRPAALSLASGSLTMAVARRIGGLLDREPTPTALVRLRPGDVAELGWGAAFLVSGSKPAVRLGTENGSLILAFEGSAARDRILAALDSWRHGRLAASPEVAAGTQPATSSIFRPGKPLVDYWWIGGIAFAVMVASLWKLVALAGPGEPIATAVAVAIALVAVIAWELASRLRHVVRDPEPSYRAVAIAGAIAMFFVVAPLGFHIGSGAAASVFWIGASALFLLAGRRGQDPG